MVPPGPAEAVIQKSANGGVGDVVGVGVPVMEEGLGVGVGDALRLQLRVSLGSIHYQGRGFFRVEKDAVLRAKQGFVQYYRYSFKVIPRSAPNSLNHVPTVPLVACRNCFCVNWVRAVIWHVGIG
jgi:hypothetical protein